MRQKNPPALHGDSYSETEPRACGITLLEANELDLIVAVHVAGHVQETSLIERDKMTPEDAGAGLNPQMPVEEKKEQADRLIDNSGSLDNTRSQVSALLRESGEWRKRKGMPRTDRSDLARGKTSRWNSL